MEDFLAFLQSGTDTWKSNRILFNGKEFRFRNDTFPKFCLDGRVIRHYLGDFTDYTIDYSSGEYLIKQFGSFTGYAFKTSGGEVELYFAGSRYYDDLDGDKSKEEEPASYTPTSSYSSSSDNRIYWPKNPYGRWGMGIVYGFLVPIPIWVILNVVAFPWPFVAIGAIYLIWLILIPIVSLFKDHISKDEDKIKSSIWYQKLNKKHRLILNMAFTMLFLSPVIALFIVGLCLFISPISIYRGISFGGVIALLVVFDAVSLTCSIFLLIAGRKNKRGIISNHAILRGIMVIVGVIATIPMFTVGLLFLPEEFHLKTAKDFNVLKNVPNASSCNYYLENDIDFRGKSSSAWGRINFSGVFDGQGYTIRNYCFEGGTDTYSCALFLHNRGTIRNIKIENSEFHTIGSKQGLRGSTIIEYKLSTNEDVYYATLAAINSGEIEVCEVIDVYFFIEGSVCSVNCGGIVGKNQGIIRDSSYIDNKLNPNYSYSINLKNNSTWVIPQNLICASNTGKLIDCICEATMGRIY